MTAPRQPPRKGKAGHWIERMLRHYGEYKKLKPGQRAGFIKSLSTTNGQAANTIWRQLRALAYLESKGIDAASITHPPALMSIEAVARAGRTDITQEARLLRRLVAKDQGSVRVFRDEVHKIQRENRAQPSGPLPAVRLSELLFTEVFGEFSASDRARAPFQIHFPASGPFSPLVLVDQGVRRTVLFWADHANTITREPNYQRLFEGAVLRSLVTCDRVIVCASLRLVELEPTMLAMRPEIRSRLVHKSCELVVDLRPPGKARFESWAAYAAEHRIEA